MATSQIATDTVFEVSHYETLFYLNVNRTTVLDASGEEAHLMFQIGLGGAGDLDLVHLLFSAVTLDAASELRISFFDLTAGAETLNTGSTEYFAILGSASINDGSMTSSGAMRSAGAAAKTVAVGDWVGIRVKYETFTAGDTISLWHNHQTTGAYVMNDIGAGVVKHSQFPSPNMSLAWTTVPTYRHVNGCSPQNTTTKPTFLFNSTSTPDTYGISVTFERDVVLLGAAFGTNQGASEDYELALFTSSGKTVLYTRIAERVAPSDTHLRLNLFTPVTLTGGTDYIISAEAQHTVNMNMNYLDFHAAGAQGIFGIDPAWCSQSAKDPADTSDFTADTTKMPWFRLLLSEVESGGAGGGLITHPGMSGGLVA